MAITLKKGKLIKSKKRKIKIISVSKNEQRGLWTFKKNQTFIPSFLNFLLKLGFNLDEDFDIKFFFGVPHEDENYLPEEYVKKPFSQEYLPIDSFNQEIYTFNKKNLDIEVIFFSDKIVISIRSNKTAKKIGELIGDFADF
jgi:hypothetical protein